MKFDATCGCHFNMNDKLKSYRDRLCEFKFRGEIPKIFFLFVWQKIKFLHYSINVGLTNSPFKSPRNLSTQSVIGITTTQHTMLIKNRSYFH
jgi:hypothetical protein